MGNFGARAAFDATLRLEMLGKNNDLNGAGEELILLANEIERLKKALQDFRGDET